MNNKQKTAIVIGATGLVGFQLIKLLLEDNTFDKVKVFTRKKTGLEHHKLEEHVIDFAQPMGWRDNVKGDVLFSALGTTLSKAGSKDQQYEVDYNYQYNTAVTAAANKVRDYVLVSAANANLNSSFFYPRIKGELEDAVTKLPFTTITIIQPNLLYGSRQSKRTLENIGIKTFKSLNKIGILTGSKPIHGRDVAQAMLYAYEIANGISIHKGNDLFSLARKYKTK